MRPFLNLMAAVNDGNVRKARRILDAFPGALEPQPGDRSQTGDQYPLEAAVDREGEDIALPSLAMVRLLVERGADVNGHAYGEYPEQPPVEDRRILDVALMGPQDHEMPAIVAYLRSQGAMTAEEAEAVAAVSAGVGEASISSVSAPQESERKSRRSKKNRRSTRRSSRRSYKNRRSTRRR
jgi:hypothetical protein